VEQAAKIPTQAKTGLEWGTRRSHGISVISLYPGLVICCRLVIYLGVASEVQAKEKRS